MQKLMDDLDLPADRANLFEAGHSQTGFGNEPVWIPVPLHISMKPKGPKHGLDNHRTSKPLHFERNTRPPMAGNWPPQWSLEASDSQGTAKGLD